MALPANREQHARRDAHEPDAGIETFRRRYRYLVFVVILLAALLAATAAWILIDRDGTSEMALTDEVVQLVDDDHAARNDRNGDAYLALVTDDVTHETELGTGTSQTEIAFIDGFGFYDWRTSSRSATP